ncbi:hypothetical protein [Amycolatopsis thermophila]|nr:hypothetical protein [Amycolatopsis thermophila]
MLLDSTTQALIHHAECPVLIAWSRLDQGLLAPLCPAPLPRSPGDRRAR